MRVGQLWESFRDKPPKEKLMFLAGVVCLGLAIVGVFLPVVPQVPFAIASAFFFSKASPRLHKWIRKNKHLGPPVVDWEDNRVVRPKLKAFSTVAMIAGAVIAYFTVKLEFAIALSVVFVGCIIFVLTRNSRKPRSDKKK